MKDDDKLNKSTPDDEAPAKDWAKVAMGDEKLTEKSDDNTEDNDVDAPADSELAGVLSHPNYKALEDELTAAEQRAHENWDKATRAMAELENVRRRTERDLANAHKFALEKFVEDLLAVVDSLEQALKSQAETEHDPKFLEGVELTLKLFIDTLKKHGVTQVNPVGEVFDPQHHEAMSMVPAPDCAPNTIIEVFQRGYLLNGRLVRPARVIVAKGA